MSQEFDNNLNLDLVKENSFYRYDCMTDFEKCKEELPSKETFCSWLIDRKICDKLYEHVINVWKLKQWKSSKTCT